MADAWRTLHRRPVRAPQSGLRVYSGAHGAAYAPSEDACAEAILGQANRRLDFRLLTTKGVDHTARCTL